MKTSIKLVIVVGMLLMGCGLYFNQTTEVNAKQEIKNNRMKMVILGEIVRGRNDTYLIRGKKPAEIFTVLNNDTGAFDNYADTGNILSIDVDIISGDNVEIKKIEGKNISKAKN